MREIRRIGKPRNRRRIGTNALVQQAWSNVPNIIPATLRSAKTAAEVAREMLEVVNRARGYLEDALEVLVTNIGEYRTDVDCAGGDADTVAAAMPVKTGAESLGCLRRERVGSLHSEVA